MTFFFENNKRPKEEKPSGGREGGREGGRTCPCATGSSFAKYPSSRLFLLMTAKEAPPPSSPPSLPPSLPTCPCATGSSFARYPSSPPFLLITVKEA